MIVGIKYHGVHYSHELKIENRISPSSQNSFTYRFDKKLLIPDEMNAKLYYIDLINAYVSKCRKHQKSGEQDVQYLAWRTGA